LRSLWRSSSVSTACGSRAAPRLARARQGGGVRRGWMGAAWWTFAFLRRAGLHRVRRAVAGAGAPSRRGEEPVANASSSTGLARYTLSVGHQKVGPSPWLRQIAHGRAVLVHRDLPPAIVRAPAGSRTPATPNYSPNVTQRNGVALSPLQGSRWTVKSRIQNFERRGRVPTAERTPDGKDSGGWGAKDAAPLSRRRRRRDGRSGDRLVCDACN
jgi:hypothetical protein